MCISLGGQNFLAWIMVKDQLDMKNNKYNL